MPHVTKARLMELEAAHLICIGCRTSWSDEMIIEMRKKDPRIIACCPERKMVTAKEALDAWASAERDRIATDNKYYAAVEERVKIEKERDHLRWRLLNTHDGVMLLADRAGATVTELGQLGLARIVMEERDGKQVPTAVAINLEDMLDMTDDAMKRQATVAQFRQLKTHFVVHQRAVTALLDQLNGLAGKNQLTGSDMQKLRDARRDLSAMIKREI